MCDNPMWKKMILIVKTTNFVDVLLVCQCSIESRITEDWWIRNCLKWSSLYQTEVPLSHMYGDVGEDFEVFSWYSVSPCQDWTGYLEHYHDTKLFGFVAVTICCLLFVSVCWPFCLQDARQLSSRPPMHCTSIILAGFGLMLLLAHVFQWPSLHHFTWILVAAVVSHHLRDSTRRGLWLYPFGSSPPIPYTGYLVGCILLPHVVPSLMQRTQPAHRPSTRPSVVLVWDGLMQHKKYC